MIDLSVLRQTRLVRSTNGAFIECTGKVQNRMENLSHMTLKQLVHIWKVGVTKRPPDSFFTKSPDDLLTYRAVCSILMQDHDINLPKQSTDWISAIIKDK